MSIQADNALRQLQIAAIDVANDRLRKLISAAGKSIVDDLVITIDIDALPEQLTNGEELECDMLLLGVAVATQQNIVSRIRTVPYLASALIVVVSDRGDELNKEALNDSEIADVIDLSMPVAFIKRRFRMMQQLISARSQLSEHRASIDAANIHVARDQQLAKEVFDKVAYHSVALPNINYWLSPIAAFNGDIFLAKPTPNGTLMVMLGDFTGHGLAAAIGAIPLASTFYGMVEKGFLLSDIVVEVNRKLNEVLPVGIFCCACIAHLDFSRKMIEVLNAGLPDCYLVRSASNDVQAIASDSLPLGVVGSDHLSVMPQRIAVEPSDRLYLLSDGILEAENEQGDAFGEECVKRVLQANRSDTMVSMQSTLAEFLAENERNDDISFVEVGVVDAAEFECYIDKTPDALSIKPGEWRLNYTIEFLAIKRYDPIPLVLHAIMEQSSLHRHSGKLFSILSELYNNALDHGLLGLDSSLKHQANGFEQYYQQRLQRLEALDDGHISFDLHYRATESEGRLIIEVADSGPGFDFTNMAANDSADAKLYGRGILLLQSICERVEFIGAGNRIQAEFRWV